MITIIADNINIVQLQWRGINENTHDLTNKNKDLCRMKESSMKRKNFLVMLLAAILAPIRSLFASKNVPKESWYEEVWCGTSGAGTIQTYNKNDDSLTSIIFPTNSKRLKDFLVKGEEGKKIIEYLYKSKMNIESQDEEESFIKELAENEIYTIQNRPYAHATLFSVGDNGLCLMLQY